MSRRNGNGKRGQSRQQMLAVRALAPHAPNLRHGALVRLRAEDIAKATGEITRVAPHLAQPRYRHGVEVLARLLARLETMDAVIAGHPKGWIIRATASGRVEIGGGERHYLLLTEQVRRMLESLGLTPQAAKALGLPVESPDEKDVVSEARELARAQQREWAQRGKDDEGAQAG